MRPCKRLNLSQYKVIKCNLKEKIKYYIRIYINDLSLIWCQTLPWSTSLKLISTIALTLVILFPLILPLIFGFLHIITFQYLIERHTPLTYHGFNILHFLNKLYSKTNISDIEQVNLEIYYRSLCRGFIAIATAIDYLIISLRLLRGNM